VSPSLNSVTRNGMGFLLPCSRKRPSRDQLSARDRAWLGFSRSSASFTPLAGF